MVKDMPRDLIRNVNVNMSLTTLAEGQVYFEVNIFITFTLHLVMVDLPPPIRRGSEVCTLMDMKIAIKSLTP